MALHRDAHDGPVDPPLGELLERPAGPGRLRHPDLRQQFVRLQRGLEQAPEERPGRDLPLRRGPARHQGRVQGEGHRGQVGRRVAVCQRAADRAPVPDLRVPHLPGRVRQQRHLAGQQLGGLQLTVPGQRSDGHVAAPVLDVGQAGDPPEVDENLGHGQAQLHERQQRVAAGKKLASSPCSATRARASATEPARW